MFNAKIVARISVGILGAVSVRGGDGYYGENCWLEPDGNGWLLNIADVTEDIPDWAFNGCDNALRAVIIPASVTNIGKFAFAVSSNLETVIFEEGSLLETIGHRAFSSCDKLKVITLPANLKKIGKNAFIHSSLERVIFEGGSLLEEIGDGAFYATNLKSINIPPDVVIGDAAFGYTGQAESKFTPGAIIVDCEVLDQVLLLSLYKAKIVEAIEDLKNPSGSSSTEIKERIMEMNFFPVWYDFLYRTALEPGEGAGAFFRVDAYKLSPPTGPPTKVPSSRRGGNTPPTIQPGSKSKGPITFPTFLPTQADDDILQFDG